MAKYYIKPYLKTALRRCIVNLISLIPIFVLAFIIIYYPMKKRFGTGVVIEREILHKTDTLYLPYYTADSASVSIKKATVMTRNDGEYEECRVADYGINGNSWFLILKNSKGETRIVKTSCNRRGIESKYPKNSIYLYRVR